MTLKDEAYVRANMRVPTSQDYPEAPKGIFKTPKDTLLNGIQGLAKLHAEFLELSSDAWRCTLTFDSASRKEVVESEGRSKVCDYIVADMRKRLTQLRNQPSPQHTCTSLRDVINWVS